MIRAARYLRADPERVMEMPAFWQNAALAAEEAEEWARAELKKRRP